MANENMTKAKNEKNDEFYTQLTDIEKEVRHYKDHFKDKVVFLNCDDPEYSNFWKYFAMNFNRLAIKKLIATHYANGKDSTYQLVIDRDDAASMVLNAFNYPVGVKSELTGDGDFRSEECIGILKEADIVCTNPPFSLFREYIAKLIEYDKQFLIIGNQNAITYKDVFALFKTDQLFLGVHTNKVFWFQVPDSYPMTGSRVKEEAGLKYISVPAISWFTNMDYPKRHETQLLFKTYTGHEVAYPTYDNYDAIEVNKTKDIPADYDGVMGVPITFLNRHNPEQFNILGLGDGNHSFDVKPTKRYLNAKQVNKDGSIVNGSKVNTRPAMLLKTKPDAVYYTADNADGYIKRTYARILIQKRKR